MSKTTGYSYIPQIYRDTKTNILTQIYLPMVSIKVSYTRALISPSFDALVDSGSDRNLFPMVLAKYLGIDFGKVKSKKIYGIGEGYIKAYPAKINILLGAKIYETEADFSNKQNIPILGRNGFFNLFRSIKFDEKGQFVYIEEF